MAGKIIDVVFRNLTYTVTVKNAEGQESERQILKQLNGVLRPGRLTAIMGASGAGKTTLLNILSAETDSGKIDGDILLNGDKATSKIIKLVSSFVHQDDCILDTMTVREAITMSAMLRLPEAMPESEKLARVDEVMKLLRLEKCADTLIGSSLIKGVSGGERKRCAIGMELVRNPLLLFLDEPTTGLDTFTAYSVIETLRQLTRTGRTVACTIHQPSSEIFHCFDDVILLAEGRIMYMGPAHDVVKYLADRKFPCPQYTNPADFIFMDVLHDLASELDQKSPSLFKDHDKAKHTALVEIDLTSGEEKKPERMAVSELLDSWISSNQAKAANVIVQEGSTLPANERGLPKASLQELVGAGTCTQMRVLFSRSFNNFVRNRMLIFGRLGQVLFMSFLVGLTYLQMGNDQKSIQDRNGALFFIGANGMMGTAIATLSSFGTEKAVFQRESGMGMYNLFSFFICKILVELPFNIIFPWIGATILYWLMGLQPTGLRYFNFSLAYTVLTNSGVAMGICIACLFNELSVAINIAPLFLLPLMIFAGLFINLDSIPPYFTWIQWLSPAKYGFAAVAFNEYEGLSFSCTDAQYRVLNGTRICPVTSGDDLLTQLKFSPRGYSINLGILAALYGGFLLLAFLNLWRLTRSKRH